MKTLRHGWYFLRYLWLVVFVFTCLAIAALRNERRIQRERRCSGGS